MPIAPIMIAFPQGYGYVFSVLGGSFLMNGYLTYLVIKARKDYDVQYPWLYAPESNKHHKEFNSVQRAHQNTLESYSMVMLQMCLCGLVYPITSAICGALFCVGKIVYGYGYASNGPNGRYMGGIISHLGDIPLLVMCMKIGYDMIVNSK